MAKTRKVTTRKPSDSEANKYDKIVKENLRALLPALIHKVLKIQVNRMESPPSVRVQTTQEGEDDCLLIIYNDEFPDGFLLAIEFEAKDEKKTDSTMHYYVGAQHLKYGLPVDLRMIYLRKGKPKNIKGGFSFFGLIFTYPIYYLFEISYKEFIYSDEPEEVILSVLANTEGLSGEEIIRMILERLFVLRGKSKALYKFIKQLKILSMLRNLRQETAKQFKEMIITPDIVRQIRESEEFQMGIEEGRVKGIAEGIEKGMEKGMEKGLEKGMEEGQMLKAIAGIRNMTLKNFDLAVIADLLQVSEEFVLDIQSQLKKEPQIIAALAKPRASVNLVARRLGVSHLLVQVIKDSQA